MSDLAGWAGTAHPLAELPGEPVRALTLAGLEAVAGKAARASSLRLLAARGDLRRDATGPAPARA